jgi:carbon-monoxide dehydrogenase medium subunit
MLLKRVEYARPGTIGEAIELLGGHDNARPLAGGQTLVNVMKVRAAAPDRLVDLNEIEELRGVSQTADGGLEIGAMTTYAALIESPEVNEIRPVLARVSAQIADVQVRNRGTIGGNVCSSDPTNHLPPLTVALGATMTIAGAQGERAVPAEDFFLGVYFTAVEPGELLTKITIPGGSPKDGFAAVTIGRDGTCIANAAASVNGAVRVALGCVDAVPVSLTPAATDERAVREAVRAAVFDPPADVHASADYRRHLAEVLAVRAVQEASA